MGEETRSSLVLISMSFPLGLGAVGLPGGLPEREGGIPQAGTNDLPLKCVRWDTGIRVQATVM